MGFTGPDQGKGGKYLFVPPDYKGELPKEGYFIVHSKTYRNWVLSRAFVKDGDKAAQSDDRTDRPAHERQPVPLCHVFAHRWCRASGG